MDTAKTMVIATRRNNVQERRSAPMKRTPDASTNTGAMLEYIAGDRRSCHSSPRIARHTLRARKANHSNIYRRGRRRQNMTTDAKALQRIAARPMRVGMTTEFGRSRSEE